MHAVRIDGELAALGASLVEERVLRRIIKRHRGIRGLGLHVPHERCYVLPQVALAAFVDPDEVAVDLRALPEQVLVTTGDRERLESDDAGAQLELWRALFHARIHLTFEGRIARGELGIAGVRERVHRIGEAELEANRFVLRQENQLLPPATAAEVYVEVVASYLELRYFAPDTLDRTFPGLERATYDAVIALDVDADALLAATRPPRAPSEPVVPRAPAEAAPEMPQFIEPAALKAADRARRKGNVARSAILAARAGHRDIARADLDVLAARLGSAFGGADTAGWSDGLLPLAELAATQPSLRTASSRILHDLQAACTIADREVKVADVIGWLLARGKRPVVRSLPATRVVRSARRARGALGKLAACSFVSAEARDRTSDVLHRISKHADDHVRAAYRPAILAALNEVGLVPHDLPERVAEKTLVDELLDRVLAAGQLSLGDLRDALSRNELKLRDLEVVELAAGDPLLRADQRLAVSLDGVYRRGEAYMRALQKMSSLLFGTRIGRVLTRYLLLPLLAAFAVVEGIQQMGAPIAAKLGYELHASTRESLLVGAGILFVLLHVPLARRGLVLALRWIWRGLRLLLFDVPLAIWRHRVVRALLGSRVFRWGVRPALPAAAVVLLADGLGWLRWPIAIGVFAAAAVIMNTRWVARAEEVAADQVARALRHVGRILPGLVKLTLELFAWLVELVERGIYRVDEWLRFRAGQSGLVLVLKGAFGVVWFFITYIVRLYVVLFVEPTVNPIKHFPVVTVAAKIILPFIPAMLSALAAAAKPLLGTELANGFAAFTILVLPGLAGFLVWELKENWKLYRATRSKTLEPIIIGHHGETMSRLLRPGFHSGTIPKLFTKLRRAALRDDERRISRAKQGLHHVEEAIEIFGARQLASILDEAEAFRARDVGIAHVELGSNRVDIELECPSVSPEPALIRIELEGEWLVASITRIGWIAALDPEQRRIFEVALAGFYKRAAIEVVREQIEHVLRTNDGLPRYAIGDEGLLVWPGSGFETEVAYDLRSRRLRPKLRGPHYEGELPVLRGRHALFGREPLFRTMWTSAWLQIMRAVVPMRVIVGPPLLAPRPDSGDER